VNYVENYVDNLSRNVLGCVKICGKV